MQRSSNREKGRLLPSRKEQLQKKEPGTGGREAKCHEDFDRKGIPLPFREVNTRAGGPYGKKPRQAEKVKKN